MTGQANSIIDEIPEGDKSPKKRLIFIIKLVLTVGALIAVFYKADLSKISTYLKDMNIMYVLISFFVLNLGQIVSAMRMRFYFSASGLLLERGFAIILYYVGMLLNLVLPGGIGGDGYKAYYINKKHKISLKASLLCIVSGRGSGLLQLVTLILICAFFSPRIMAIDYAVPLIIACFFAAYIGYYILARYLLKEALSTQIKGAIYSFVIQGSVIITVLLLLHAMDFKQGIIDYIILFQISSIVAVLPISVGGIGVREAAFFYLAPFFTLDPELGVTLSIAYFCISASASMFGAIAFMLLGKRKV